MFRTVAPHVNTSLLTDAYIERTQRKERERKGPYSHAVTLRTCVAWQDSVERDRPGGEEEEEEEERGLLVFSVPPRVASAHTQQIHVWHGPASSWEKVEM
uniref:Uncharacterized protein n=1 Tax=Knipowitschia caucasica TaxID=637954 RepID=A0AAV2LKN8_KNICA